MTDKILLIENVENVKAEEKFGDQYAWYSYYDGLHIKTEKNEIWFLIDNSQNCCEEWGYISSEEDYTAFIGAEYLGYDNIKAGNLMQKLHGTWEEEQGTVFLNVQTSKGLLQFAVYNYHNGWYGHNVICVINDKIEEKTI